MLNKLIVIALLGLLSTSVLAANWYHYRDNEGGRHIGASIPPEYIANGYEIRNAQGRVVEVVPPKAELDKQAAAAMEVAKQRRSQELQRQKDELLLRHYSMPEDVERVRDRRLDEFDNFVAIQNGNIRAYKKRISQLQSRAANIERAGRQVPASILENLQTLEQNIRESKGMIDAKLKEKVKVAAAFDRDIQRIKELRGIEDPVPEEAKVEPADDDSGASIN